MRRRSAGGEGGFTTVELMVVLVLMGILGAVSLGVYLSMNRASTLIDARVLSTSEARSVIDSWSRLFMVMESPTRDADAYPAVERLSPSELIFYASVENRPADSVLVLPPERIRIHIEDGFLVEDRFAFGAEGWPQEPSTHRVLGSDAQLSFRGLDASGDVVGLLGAGMPALCQSEDGPVAGLCSQAYCDPGAPCAGVEGADALLSTIVRVEYNLTLRDANGQQRQFVSGGAE